MSLLVFNNVVKEYRNRLVLDGAGLRIEKGERVALVGPNGAGKTTLLRIAAGLETSDAGSVSVARGTKMGYLTQDLAEMDPGGRIFKETALYHEEVSRLEQKIRSLESAMAEPRLLNDQEGYDRVMKEYSRLVTRFEGMDGYTMESKIKSMLLGLGLKEESLTLPVELLSGGEKMRVALARILLEEPDLLVLDEPTNHLDIEGVEWLEGFLKRFDGGVLVVSHDRYFLDQVATRVAELENGTIIERSGNYSTFMEQKEKLREFALREQFRLRQEIKRENSIADQLKSSRKISAWKSRLKTVQRLENELNVTLKGAREQQHLYRTAAPGISFDKVGHMSADIAMADRLEKCYGKVPLFTNVTFEIKGGERVGVIGPNGCGKSTLINILLGNDENYMGRARLGEWVRYGYLGQEVEFEDEGRTILEELLSAKDMEIGDARNYLARFQFYGDEVDKHIEVLSGGEKVRLYLACMMLESPDCLIMDEPTNHLDVPARNALESAILEFGGTIIAVSHDRYFLNRCINRILEFSDGTLHSYEGNYDAYRLKKRGPEASAGMAEQRGSISKPGAGMPGAGSKPAGDHGRPAGINGKPAGTDGGADEAENELNGSGSPVIRRRGNRHGGAGISAAGADSIEMLKKKDLERIEARISELEEKQQQMESLFGPETPPATYFEYDGLLKELDQLYGQLS